MEILDVDNKVENRKIKQKKYNQTFMEKHKEKLRVKNQCFLCKGEYSYYNKSKHNKTKRHLKFIPQMFVVET